MNEKTILVSGAFNPLHFGHLLLLREASKYGKVIVALNSDEWVLKNKGYLLFDFETRKSLLEECQHVHKVIPFDDSEGDVTFALFEVRPTYFGNGGSATETGSLSGLSIGQNGVSGQQGDNNEVTN